MKNCSMHLVKASLLLAAAVMLVFVAGCDDEYDLGHGRPYLVPAERAYYYSPYVETDYYSYGYPYSTGTVNTYYYTPYRSYGYAGYGYGLGSPYRSYGRGIGRHGFVHGPRHGPRPSHGSRRHR